MADLEQAADDYSSLELRFDAARSLLALGRALRRLRKWGAARDVLEDAATAFDAIGSPGWTEAARAGARPARRPATGTGGRAHADRAAGGRARGRGLANKEIAQTLVVTVSTVEFHLSNIYGKLGIRSRAQLAGRLRAEAPRQAQQG